MKFKVDDKLKSSTKILRESISLNILIYIFIIPIHVLNIPSKNYFLIGLCNKIENLL